MAIPSPCTGLCRIGADRAWCQGCLRTVDEIRAWPRADDRVRQAILERIVARRAAAAGLPGGAQA